MSIYVGIPDIHNYDKRFSRAYQRSRQEKMFASSSHSPVNGQSNSTKTKFNGDLLPNFIKKYINARKQSASRSIHGGSVDREM